MTKLIKSIFEGMGQVLVLSPNRSYIRPQSNGFKRDAARMAKDMRTVGNGLRAKIRLVNGEPADHR